MSQKEKVLEMLLSGPKTTADFLQAYIPRFSARIKDLRKDGHTIHTEPVSKGKFLYFLEKDRQGHEIAKELDFTISNIRFEKMLDQMALDAARSFAQKLDEQMINTLNSQKQFEGGLF